MSNNDPNIQQIEIVVRELGGLADELVLVGGYAAGLLVADAPGVSIRPTTDVGVLASTVCRKSRKRSERRIRLSVFF